MAHLLVIPDTLVATNTNTCGRIQTEIHMYTRIYKQTLMQGLNSAHPDFWSEREEPFEEEPPAGNMITVVCQIVVVLCADINCHNSAHALCDHDVSCMYVVTQGYKK